MKSNTNVKTVTYYIDKIYDFDDPVQRGGDQWDITKKRKLIDSILRNYPIDPVRWIVENREGKDVNVVIDGKQRLQTIIAFLNDEFTLTNDISPEFLGDLKEAKYSELPYKVKELIRNYEFTHYGLEDVTDEQKREIFERQNSGKPLTKAQMNSTKLTKETYKTLKDIIEDRGLNKEEYGLTEAKDLWHTLLSEAVFRNGEDRNIILSILMLIDGNYNVDFGLGNEEIQNFIDKFNGMSQEEKEALRNKVINAADYASCYVCFGDKIKNLKKVSIPMFLAGMSYAIDNNKNIDKYIENVRDYFENYGHHTDYQNTVKSSSNKKDNVEFRMKVFKGFADKAGTAEEGVDYRQRLVGIEKEKEIERAKAIEAKEIAKKEKAAAKAEKAAAKAEKEAAKKAKEAAKKEKETATRKRTTKKTVGKDDNQVVIQSEENTPKEDTDSSKTNE